MSFSQDVKGELARIELSKKCCMLAEIAGFLRVSSSVKLLGGGKFGIVATTENAATARHFKVLIESYFRNKVSMEIGDSQRPGSRNRRVRNRYYMNIGPDEKSMQILRETGILLIREGDDYFSDGIYQPIVKSKCCKRAYLRGMFLSCGTMSDPRRSYHLEFVLDKERSAADLKKLIGTFTDLSAGMVKRGESYVVYMKKAAYISDMLGIMGAEDAVLELEGIRVNKNMHGNVRRMINCDEANAGRTVAAAGEQMDWIRKIAEDELGCEIESLSDEEADFDETMRLYREGLRYIPQPLREVALLRLERPEASLTEIGESLSPPIGKAAVNKRFAKIKAISENCDGQFKE